MRDEVVSRARLEAKTAGLEASLAKARVDALRMELNPHFFNTLTAIAGLVGQDRKVEARQVIGRLAELLRRALDGREGHFATVTAEVEALENYLFIQRLRLEDRLRIHLAVDPCARDCLVPAMLLQQLVENAIRHGIEPLEGQGAVTIRIDRVDGSIRLVVRDTGVGLPCRDDGLPVREGIGLSNTRARLVHLYGERAVLQLSNCTGDAGGAEAIVVLPATQLPQKAMKSTPRPAAARPGA